MPSKDPLAYFEDIRQSILDIEAFTGGIRDVNGLLADRKTRLAVKRCLSIISEAAVRLGEEGERRAPDLPWRQIRGIGNHLRHGYDGLDHRMLWSTLQNDLAPLRRACEEQIAKGR